MNSDVALVVGLMFVLFSVPALISGFSGGRPLRQAAVLAALGGILIAFAAFSSPTAYRAEDVPEVVMRVIAYFFR